ncbi:DnaB-like helicase C-terminal domain-containing protein [Streptomyces sp. GESEQ-4]|uniref:DnaB-like helicase C-terminal domain-containing protein n=1 Tax=Streptomyces sp. GESEQ-4 TaxID=2812655 RepID=UPI0027DE43AD|nr:DnaB-like helicase C-terminal domain-containing protein [Streptomyces sp. GESEQ-4]
MSRAPQAENAMNATEARKDLYALVKRAEEHGVTTLIHKRQDRALLAPLDRLPAARKSEAFPSHVLSAAQKDFGDLITRAAQGQPQVLRRNTTPVAILLPVDTASGVLSSDTAAHTGAAPAGGAVNSQGNPDRDRTPRRLATLGDAIGSVLTSSPGGPTFGLPGLDAATGGLQPGRLMLVAAAPNVGGSLLGLAAARQTALVDHRKVLYAASGPNRADIFRRVLAAETGGDYPRLKQGHLTEHEQQVAQQLRQKASVLLIDDGSDLTAEAIAETAPHVEDLALVVVDRFQAAHNARLPLSGNRLPDASQILAGLARSLHVPVLAIVDSDDPTLLSLLDADILVTLAPAEDPSTVQVTVAERDFGTIGSAYLQPDLLHARFLDAGIAPAGGTGGEGPAPSLGSAAEQELAEAALPYTSGAQQGLPASVTHVLAALRTALTDGDQEARAELGPSLAQVTAAPLHLPDTAEGRRLAAALRAYATAEQPAAAAAQSGASTGHVPDDADVEDTEEGDEDGLAPGDEEDEPEDAVFPALRILKDAVDRSKMHPIKVIRLEERDNGPWPLISEDMDGEPRWVHPDVTSARVAHTRENGKRVRRDKLDVPDSFGDGVMCLIDRNGSYPSACSAVPLAPNKLLHTGALKAFDKTQAGIYLIDIPQWTRTDMPHPLGRIIERPDEQGRVWVTAPHIKQLEKLVRDGHLDAAPTIHDSWTGKVNESLFKPFYEATRKARTELVQVGGDPYKAYKTRLSIALRLLWPKREEQRSPFWRPDWRMSMVAEASVRHWAVAFRAVQDGHTLIALRNVDAAVFWTPDGTPPATYRIGTGFGEVKAKYIQRGEIIPEGDD